ncbi:phytanoyl-CoA dioxygenase family protein [Pelagibius marinus]|uniref:phytanoyl-CoA dioxygenase family protein n=1 Tax=Pelagibius marinus TaxID=2762760 RepID=UPI001873311C|nr:phytanoyl-CoA dioxygenase family protein [Pelagibius marinus]
MALACLAAEAERAGDRLAAQGYALVDGSAVDRTAAVAAFDALRAAAAEDEGSARIAPDVPLIGTLLAQPAVRDIVREALGPSARPVRAIAFDKTGHRNWFVPWHQDRTIAVKRRDASAPVGNWTVKAGVPHCEAPVDLLERMLTLRWHLDLIGPADGGLRVLPGSHTKGRLTTEEIAVLASETPAVELAVSAGTVLVLRPLLVHGSRRRTTRGHRRILHVELAAGDPPPPLEWAWA